ncbi:hypothetical protein VR46_00275 [Streptomyces sp. NRRL S-444]|nr:hypothetical protein VR46_00275 [Streptomyces sp. NRRL S-444]
MLILMGMALPEDWLGAEAGLSLFGRSLRSDGPEVAGGGDVRFSLSHSGGLALIATAAEPVGVDSRGPIKDGSGRGSPSVGEVTGTTSSQGERDG